MLPNHVNIEIQLNKPIQARIVEILNPVQPTNNPLT